jgi:hypothetical protein
VVDRKGLDEFVEDQPDPELARLQRELVKTRNELTTARAAHRAAEAELEFYRTDAANRSQVESLEVKPARWAKPKKRYAKGAATAVIMLSDLHLDEVIDPTEVAGMNAYNRDIALQRLQRTAEGAVRLGTQLMGGFTYEGAVVVLGGDLVHGNLHDNAEWNETPSVIETVDYWADHLAAFLETIAEAYGPVHVLSVAGNHGRLTLKPRTRGRAQDSFDTHLARLVERHYRTDPRFAFSIGNSADAYLRLYDTNIVVTHGDQGRGGSGISGLLTPVSLLEHRKRKRDQSFGRGFDHLFMGHWHTYLRTGTVTVNGCLSGLDAYAFLGNFGYEEPSQAFAVVTPEHGVTIEAPIFSVDRKTEGW